MNRSGTLPKKDTKRLLESLRKQGCRIRRMTRGYRVEFPNGGSTMIHLTNSDSRGTLNTRAEIRRAGLIYPGDQPQHEKEKKVGKSLSEKQEDDLRSVMRRVKEVGLYASVPTLAKDAGVSEHTIKRRLHALGWTTQGAARGTVWYAPGAAPAPPPAPEYPEIERAKAMVGPGQGHERLTFPRPGEEKTVEPNGRGSWPMGKPLTTIDIQATEADRKMDEILERMSRKPEPPPEREFIDSVESWTIAVPDRLASMAAEMGLQIEVRVWR